MKYIVTFPFVDSELESIILDCVDENDAVRRACQHACWFVDINPRDLETLNKIGIALLPNDYEELIVEPIDFNLTKYLGNRDVN